MSKAVLISIRPKWVEKIANGEKTIEVRKTKPKLETPFKCYIYCTLPKYPHEDFIATDYPMPQFYGGGKVIGEFTCERIAPITYDGGRLWCPTNAAFSPATCLSQAEIIAYIGDKGRCYGWHISDLRIYDTPRELSEFTPACRYKNDDGSCPSRRVACSYQKYDYNPDGSINLVECGRTLERPPQSWCYVDDVQAK
jgi:predicted transcriptional regulator